MQEIIPSAVAKYKKWKEQNPDEDYQYDEIMDFVASISRGDVLDVFEYALEKAGK